LLLLDEQLFEALLRHEIQQIVDQFSVLNPPADSFFQGRWNVDHGPLFSAAHRQIERRVLLAGLAMTTRFAARTAHDD
jgi:hypothetical protein